jgi:predicted permease
MQLFLYLTRILGSTERRTTMRTLLQDIRYGVRLLLKQPAFSVAAALVLSLGIGGSTAMFGIVNALLFKPLLIRDPGQIVGCFSRDTQKPDSYRAFSYPNYADLRDNNPVFSSLMAHNLAMVGITEGDNTRRAFADAVSSNYFSTLGVPLFRGREFTPAEEQPSGIADPVTIVSYTYWRKTGADPDLLGKTLQINGRIYTVVGIAAKGFSGTMAMLSPDLYLPLGMYNSVANDFEGRGQSLGLRSSHVLIVAGRLKNGVTIEAANTSLALVADRLARGYPDENKNQTILAHALARNSVSTSPSTDNAVTLPGILLVAMAGIVLLIASLNVANMMLARGAARRREIAIRQSLGGARRDIFQQLLIEGLILAFIGGGAGVALAAAGTTVLLNSLARLAPVDLVVSAVPDFRVLLATSGFCILSALVFSLGPARSLSKSSIVTGLKDGEQGKLGSGRALLSPRNLLVMGQIALSLTLLTAAGLFIRSASTAANVEPGFRTKNEILIEVDPSLAGYDETRGRQIYREVLDRVRATPAVQSAGLAATVPFGMIQLGRTIRRSSEGLAAGSDSSKQSAEVSCRFNLVSDDYFATLGIPLLQGREFRRSDTNGTNSGRIVVLDEMAAKRLWPGGNAIGQQILLDSLDRSDKEIGAQVVGVVADVQENTLGEGLQPHVYLPFGQEYQSDMTLHVKGASQDANFLQTIRRTVLDVDSRLPILAVKTLSEHLEGSFELWIVRTAARLFSIFGAAALMLATVGLYGLRAYTVVRRTREIGIRLALGAKPSDARRMILREGLLVTAIGTVAGFGLSLLAGKTLASLLYKVSGVDPLVFFSATAVLTAVSMLACYLPALRASRVDPMIALRYE